MLDTLRIVKAYGSLFPDEADLMTLPGVDLATSRRIVAGRRARGYFKSLDELCGVAALTPELSKSLAEMSAEIGRQKEYKRQ